MDLNIFGHILLEKNPIFSDPEQRIGKNDLKYIILSCFENDVVERFKQIVLRCNGGKALGDRMSFPIGFERVGRQLQCHIMCKFRNPQPDTLLKRIDFESNLREVPLQDWIGKKFSIRVRVVKYNFRNQESDSDVIAGGSSTIRKGYVYHIKSIELA